MAEHDLSDIPPVDKPLVLTLGDHYLIIVKEEWVTQNHLGHFFPVEESMLWSQMQEKEAIIDQRIRADNEAREKISQFLDRHGVFNDHIFYFDMENFRKKGLTAGYFLIPSTIYNTGTGSRNYSASVQNKKGSPL